MTGMGRDVTPLASVQRWKSAKVGKRCQGAGDGDWGRPVLALL